MAKRNSAMSFLDFLDKAIDVVESKPFTIFWTSLLLIGAILSLILKFVA